MTRMISDERTVVALWETGEESGCDWTVGKNKVVKIEAYKETGDMGWVPWFLVTYKDGSYMRVNAAHLLAVKYAAPAGDGEDQ